MSVQDTSAGFRLQGRMGGGEVKKMVVKFKDTETLTKGDMVNLESGEADLSVTGDTGLAGIALQTLDGTDSTTDIEIVCDPDAIYAVYDPNARTVGTKLDITGTTGAQTVTTSVNADLVVVANSAADELTLVMISPASHILTS